MDCISNCIQCCAIFPCVNPFDIYSDGAMQIINTALGNIKNSHDKISFIALINVKYGCAKIVQQLASDQIFFVPAADLEEEENENDRMDEKERKMLMEKKKKRMEE